LDTQGLIQDIKLITSLHAENKLRIPGTLHPLAMHLCGMVLVKHKYRLNFAFWVVEVFWNLFALNVSMTVIIACCFHSFHFKCIIYFNNLVAVFMLWLCSELCQWDINKHFCLCFFFMVPWRRNTYTLYSCFSPVFCYSTENMWVSEYHVLSPACIKKLSLAKQNFMFCAVCFMDVWVWDIVQRQNRSRESFTRCCLKIWLMKFLHNFLSRTYSLTMLLIKITLHSVGITCNINIVVMAQWVWAHFQLGQYVHFPSPLHVQ
jgi:hypothetical protein